MKSKLKRIIINNRSKETDYGCLELVLAVVGKGKISGTGDKKQYCYAVKFKSGPVVFCSRTRTGQMSFDVRDA